MKIFPRYFFLEQLRKILIEVTDIVSECTMSKNIFFTTLCVGTDLYIYRDFITYSMIFAISLDRGRGACLGGDKISCNYVEYNM